MLKLTGAALAGLAASPVEAGASGEAAQGEGASLAIAKPFSRALKFTAQGALLDGNGLEAQYLVSGSGILDVDARGRATLQNVNATANYVSGPAFAGTIRITQSTGACPFGKYAGEILHVSAPVLYSDANFLNQPATVSVNGRVAAGAASLTMTTDFRNWACGDPDIGIAVIWSRAC